MRLTSAAGLRDLRWQDIAALDPLEQQLFGRDAWSTASWWSELAARPHTAYRVVQDTGGGPDAPLLGYAGLARSRPAADIMTLAVAPQAQGHGYGRLLLDWLIEEATSAGAQALLLEVRADNRAALALYRAGGFEPISVRRGYYQPDDVDAVVMRRHLTPAEETVETTS